MKLEATIPIPATVTVHGIEAAADLIRAVGRCSLVPRNDGLPGSLVAELDSRWDESDPPPEDELATKLVGGDLRHKPTKAFRAALRLARDWYELKNELESEGFTVPEPTAVETYS